MKKYLALLLAMLTFVSMFAGCGEKKEKEPEEPKIVYDDPRQEALVVVAEAYYARRSYFQYDDSRLVTGSAVNPVIYRWSRCHDVLENSPEDGTSQYTCYTNCAAWVHDVYLEAFDFDIVAWYVGLYHDDLEMRVMYHTVTGSETQEEKDALFEEFKSKLQVGDVINYNKIPSGAHTMLYVGEGKILHSTVPSGSGGGDYNYNDNVEKSESQGTIALTMVDEMHNDSTCSAYLWDKKSFSITRPLQKFPQMQISEKTQNRIDNLQNIVVEMTSSHPQSITADLGEEITFTFSIRNGRSKTATLAVEDIVPEGSTYVSGADKVEGNKVSWNVKVPAGETVKVSYTVKVNNDATLYDGGYIFSEDAKVGGVNVRCRPVYVGKHLTADQQKAIGTAAAAVSAGSLKGTDLAEKIYADAGVKISMDSATSILNGLYKSYKGTPDHKELNLSSKYLSMVAPTMYGGYYVANSDRFYSRTRGMRGIHIMAGDVIICKEKGKVTSFLYAGNNKVYDLDNATMLDSATSRNALWATIGHDVFIIVRPAMQ